MEKSERDSLLTAWKQAFSKKDSADIEFLISVCMLENYKEFISKIFIPEQVVNCNTIEEFAETCHFNSYNNVEEFEMFLQGFQNLSEEDKKKVFNQTKSSILQYICIFGFKVECEFNYNIEEKVFTKRIDLFAKGIEYFLTYTMKNQIKDSTDYSFNIVLSKFLDSINNNFIVLDDSNKDVLTCINIFNSVLTRLKSCESEYISKIYSQPSITFIDSLIKNNFITYRQSQVLLNSFIDCYIENELFRKCFTSLETFFSIIDGIPDNYNNNELKTYSFNLLYYYNLTNDDFGIAIPYISKLVNFINSIINLDYVIDPLMNQQVLLIDKYDFVRAKASKLTKRIEEIANYKNRYAFNDIVLQALGDILCGNQKVVELMLNEICNTKSFYIIALMLRALDDDIIDTMKKKSTFMNLINAISDERFFNDELFDKKEVLGIHYLCELGLLLKKEASVTEVINIINTSIIKGKEDNRMKIAAFSCSILAKLNEGSFSQIRLLPLIIDTLIDSSNEEIYNSIFKSVEFIIENIGKDKSVQEKNFRELIEFLTNIINKIEDDCYRHDLVMFIIRFFKDIAERFSSFAELFNTSPFTLLHKLFKSVKDLKPTKEDINALMKTVLNNEEKIENIGFLYFLLKWMKEPDMIIEFCKSWIHFAEDKKEIVKLYKAGANSVFIKTVGEITENQLNLIWPWVTEIGTFAFYKIDIKVATKTIIECSSENAKHILDMMRHILMNNKNASNSLADEYFDNEKIRRKMIDTIILLGGASYFIPLFTEKKDMSASYVTSLMSFIATINEIDDKTLFNQHFFALLDAAFWKIDPIYFENEIVTELKKIYRSSSQLIRKEMYNEFITDFTLIKRIPGFIDGFFGEFTTILKGENIHNFFIRLYFGFNENMNDTNQDAVDMLCTLFERCFRKESIGGLIIYFFAGAYRTPDSLMTKVCLRTLCSDFILENYKDLLSFVFRDFKMNPFISMFKSTDPENIALTIKLLAIVIETTDAKDKENLYNEVWKVLVHTQELSSDKIANNVNLAKLVLEEKYSVKTQLCYLPFVCHFLKNISEKDLDDILKYLVAEASVDSDMYYMCIVYIMFATKDYVKWSSALLPLKDKLNNVNKVIKAINIFCSLPEVTPYHYIEIYRNVLDIIISNQWLDVNNIGIIIFSIIRRVVFKFPNDKISGVNVLVKLTQVSFFMNEEAKCEVIPISKFSDEYKEIISKFVCETLNFEFETTESLICCSKLIATLRTLKDQSIYELLEYFSNLGHQICVLEETRKNNKIYSVAKSILSEEKLQDIDKKYTTCLNEILNKSRSENIKVITDEVLSSYTNEIKTCSERDLEQIKEITSFKIGNIEEEIMKHFLKIEEDQEKDKSIKDLRMKKLMKKLTNPISGWYSFEKKKLVQDMSIDSYGRHYKCKFASSSSCETKTRKIMPSFERKVREIKDASSVSFDAILKTVKNSFSGRINCASDKILFRSYNNNKIKIIDIKDITKVISLDGTMQCEIFTNNYESFLFLFNFEEVCKDFTKHLKTKGLSIEGGEQIEKIVSEWEEKKINNFEFLFWINMFSGRSYHKIETYPLFPCVITNYEDKSLDIKNDLRNFKAKSRRPTVNEINSYLKDCLNIVYCGVAPMKELRNTADILVELIPEFFSSEILLENVKLPPWAKNASHFILMNRIALESSYVTDHLLEWVKKNINKNVTKSKGFSFLNSKTKNQKEPIKLKVEELETLTKNIADENKDENDSIKIVTEGDYLYIIKSDIKVIKLSTAVKETNNYNKLPHIPSPDNCLIYPKEGYIVIGTPNEESFTFFDIKKLLNQLTITKLMYPISSLSGSDFKSIISCHNDSTVIVWKDIQEGESKIISAHNYTVVQSQSSIPLNSIVTVDKNCVMIVSSYSTCTPYSKVKLRYVPKQTLLTNMGLIVSIFTKNDTIIIEVRDLMCKLIHTKEMKDTFSTACIVHMPNCIEYLALCTGGKIALIRLYDMEEIKSIVLSYDVASVAFNQEYKCLIAAQKTGKCHFYNI